MAAVRYKEKIFLAFGADIFPQASAKNPAKFFRREICRREIYLARNSPPPVVDSTLRKRGANAYLHVSREAMQYFMLRSTQALKHC